jgi:hypothetical protein
MRVCSQVHYCTLSRHAREALAKPPPSLTDRLSAPPKTDLPVQTFAGTFTAFGISRYKVRRNAAENVEKFG